MKKRLLLSKKKLKSFNIFFENSFFIFNGFLGKIKYKFSKKILKVVLKKKNNSFLLKKLFFFSKSLYFFQKILNFIFVGCCFGWFLTLEFSGRGYSFICNQKSVKINLGFSHGIGVLQSKNISLVTNKSLKNKIFVHSIDFFFLKNFSFKLRSLRPLDSYKGRGLKYENELVKLKVGKRTF